jgi:hypothetical protein
LARRCRRGGVHPITRISEGAAPDEVIPSLNDYAEAIISSVHEAGGDVLKLMGRHARDLHGRGKPPPLINALLRRGPTIPFHAAQDMLGDAPRDLALAHDDQVCAELLEVRHFVI